MMRDVSLPVALSGGGALGVLLAVIGLFIGNAASGGETTIATDTARSPSTSELWLGPTRLIPTALDLAEGEVTLSFQLKDVGATTPGQRPPAELAIAVPEVWTLETDRGEFPGSTANVRARTARFEVPAGFALPSVVAVRLDAWRMRVPLVHRLDLSASESGDHELDEGVAVAIRQIIEQPDGILVELGLSAVNDPFTVVAGGFGAPIGVAPSVRGLGPGWAHVGPLVDGVQLTFAGAELPEPIPLLVSTNEWVTVLGEERLDVRGLGS